jgi:hypothetical protein
MRKVRPTAEQEVAMQESAKRLLGDLSPQQKAAVLQELLADRLAGLEEERVILGEDKRVLGYLVPAKRWLEILPESSEQAAAEDVIASAKDGMNFTDTLAHLRSQR